MLQGSGNIDGYGNALANGMFGNAGEPAQRRRGADQLTGNTGNDVFAFQTGQASGDVVVDFIGNGAAAGDSFQFIGFGTAAGAQPSRRSAPATSGRFIPVSTPTTRRSLSNGATVHASDFLFG